MSAIEDLLHAYESFIRLPWDRTLAGAQKVWFAVYDPAQERRLRHRLPEFEIATKKAGHSWACLDLTDSFAEWMASHEYREAYFESPEFLPAPIAEYADSLAEQLRGLLTASAATDGTVVAVCGVASLFGLASVSVLVEAVAPDIRGRLLVLFPGQRDGSNYRLLDARDGWNYLAVPIEATEG